MKSFFIYILVLMNFYEVNAHRAEFMMKILDSNGNYVSTLVWLYFPDDLYNYYRMGESANYSKYDRESNVACDLDENYVHDPTWAPIVPGEYILRVNDKFIFLFINDDHTGDGDFQILFQNQEFSLIMNNRGVTISETRDWYGLIIVNQKLFDDETDIGTVAYWEGDNFSDRKAVPFDVNIDPEEIIPFDADSDIYQNQKFFQWEYLGDFDGIKQTSIITGYSALSIKSKFKEVHSLITIRNNLKEAIGLNAGNIKFKDPWLIDYPDPQYDNNLRNRGMKETGPDKLEFKQRSSPFIPDYTTNYNGDVYKGVFLDQNPTFDPNLPNYSVEAISPQTININGNNHKFYFQNWSGTNVGFQNANDITTGVVFQNDNAVVNANYKGNLVSNTQSAISSNSQKKVAKTSDGTLHMVYESMNQIWYTKSEDNGNLIFNKYLSMFAKAG